MQIKRILVPVDFSEQSKHALHEACLWAHQNGADLTVLNVHEIEALTIMDFSYVESPDHLNKACDHAENILRAWVAAVPTKPANIRVEVKTGGAVDTIIEASKDHDLVIMGTHGRTGISHFLMGSVTERVAQGAKCSVLIVRPKATA